MEVARIFSESQISQATHRKLAAQLRAEQESSAQKDAVAEFFAQFCAAVHRVLTIKKGEVNADRVVKFIGFYINSISPQYDEDDSDTPEYIFEFVDELLLHLSRGMTAKDKVVRFRVNQLITTVLQNATIVGDECCQTLLNKSLGRLADRDASIRTQAVLTLASLASDPEAEKHNLVVEQLLQMMESDPSADVRRAALLNAPKHKKNYEQFVERSRDVSATNRRAVFSKVMPAIGDFRLLRRNLRERLLTNGLKDRDVSVRQAATAMMLSNWLRTVNNDMIKLLSRLDVMNGEIAEQALNAFFQARHDVVTEKIRFDDDFWATLSPEGAFLVRCYNRYCRDSGLTALAEERLPELSEFAKLLANCWQRYVEADAENVDNEDFIIEEMLTIAATYDFSDEFGRQSLLQIIDTILTGDIATSQQVVEKAVLVLRRALSIVSDFMLKISDLLDEVSAPPQDPDTSVLTFKLIQLSIIEATLRNLDTPYNDLATLNTLYDHFSPALRSNTPEVCTRGIYCLGLLCLINKAQTDAHFEQLLELYNDSSELYEEDSEINTAIIKGVSDVLLTHRVYPDAAKRARDTIAHAFSQDEWPDLKIASAQALAKLFMCSMLNAETELLGKFVGTYFTSSDNAELQQVLSFFVPVYALNSTENQRRIGLQFDTIYDMASEVDGLGCTQILAQLVEWTSPQRVDDPTSTVHGDLAIKLLRRVLDASALERRALLSAASKLTLCLEANQVEVINELLAEIDKLTLDKIAAKSLSVFREIYQARCQLVLPGASTGSEVAPEAGSAESDRTLQPSDTTITGAPAEPLLELEDVSMDDLTLDIEPLRVTSSAAIGAIDSSDSDVE